MNYQLKINPRAKHIKLTVCPYRGLIISAPRKLSNKKVQELLNHHQQWIAQQQQKHADKNTKIDPELKLHAVNEHYFVKIQTGTKNQLIAQQQQLHIIAQDNTHAVQLLRQWIRHKAKAYFATRLDYWSQKTGLNYTKLTVRSQKSRWGSCSSRGTISLNDQLIFMPSSILDYIIIHELCHTLEPNHSQRFWAQVEHHDPSYKQQEQLLAQSMQLIPRWFRASLYR